MSGMYVETSAAGSLADHIDGEESVPGGLLENVRLLEFFFALFLISQSAAPGLPVTFPASYLAMGVLLVVASLRRPRWSLRPLNGYVWAFVALIGYYAVVSATGVQSQGSGDWGRRLLRMTMLLFFIGALASGRLHLPSVVKGYCVGLLANAALFFVGVAPHVTASYLTGFAGEKNMAGLMYGIGGLLAFSVAQRRIDKIWLVALFAALVFLTGSRTTIAGYTAGVAWAVWISRLPPAARLMSGAALVWGLQYAEQNLARIGIYSNRSGTDWFREQIAQGVTEKVSLTPPQGMGLGEAYVTIPQGNFFFHNSYDTLFVEGGYVAMIVVLGVTALLVLRPFRGHTASWNDRVVEGAGIALLVCAWQLGEVFLTVSWGLVIASAMQNVLNGSREAARARSRWLALAP